MGKFERYLNNADSYIEKYSVNLTDIQKSLREETAKLPRSVMLSTPEQMQFLANLCRSLEAKKTIDIGVFTGYSALTIASVLPDDGVVVGLDISQEYADVGIPYWKQAKVDHKIKLKIAPALTSLQTLVDDGQSSTFDFAFVDAIKEEYHLYYQLLLKLVRPRGVIAFDNMFGFGKCLNEEDLSESSECLRKLALQLKNDSRVNFSLLNVGDGVGLAFVN